MLCKKSAPSKSSWRRFKTPGRRALPRNPGLTALGCALLLWGACPLKAAPLGAQSSDSSGTQHWFIALPLRFTQLQDHNTLLSGIEIGRTLAPRLRAGLAVYHSFYLQRFKAPVVLPGFEQPPRLFINCVGAQMVYTLLDLRRAKLNAALLLGWGFLKYDLKAEGFSSTPVNYLAAEPAVLLDLVLNRSTVLGIGVGYRSLPPNRRVPYRSAVGNGDIAVHRKFPNGLNLQLTLTGYF